MMKLSSASIVLLFTVFLTTSVKAATFDMKAKLLHDRGQQTNHLEKDAAYDLFRRHDARTIQTLEKMVEDYEKVLFSNEQDEDGADQIEATRLKWKVATDQLHQLLHETDAEHEARWDAFHKEMVDVHTVGLEDLDFGRTGL